MTLFVSMTELPVRAEKGDKAVFYQYADGKKLFATEEMRHADRICVYVGQRKMEEALKFATLAKVAGKEVLVYACSCNRTYKEQFADKHGLDMTFTDFCGGFPQMADMIRATISEQTN